MQQNCKIKDINSILKYHHNNKKSKQKKKPLTYPIIKNFLKLYYRQIHYIDIALLLIKF